MSPGVTVAPPIIPTVDCPTVLVQNGTGNETEKKVKKKIVKKKSSLDAPKIPSETPTNSLDVPSSGKSADSAIGTKSANCDLNPAIQGLKNQGLEPKVPLGITPLTTAQNNVNSVGERREGKNSRKREESVPKEGEKKKIRFRKYCLEDFNLLNVLGRGSFGKVSSRTFLLM